MSGQLRTLKNRIRSVESTKKITRAMEMVAAAKLNRFQTLMKDAQPYTKGLESMVKRLYKAQSQKDSADKKGQELLHPFFEKKEEKRICVVLMTSDTGLCGTFNADLISSAKKFLNAQDEKPLLIGLGKTGIAAMKREGYEFIQTYTDLRASRVEEVLSDFKSVLEKIYLENKVDAIYVVYSHFMTLTTYTPTIEKLLPLEEPKEEGEEQKQGPADDYIYEPSPALIFEQLIPLFFESKTRMVFLESFVSEQIARMNAMHQATKNAKEMIDSLVLLRNKIRQAAITKELIEIVSGSQALKLK